MNHVDSARMWLRQCQKALARQRKLIKREHLCAHERFYQQRERLRDYENNPHIEMTNR